MPLQLVHRAATITLHSHDHGVLGAGRLAARADRARRRRAASADGPGLRAADPGAAHTAADAADWWITITECHPILEGWSFHTMLMEILDGYGEMRDGRVPAETEPADFRYADYVAAEAQARRSDEHRDYWRKVIEGGSAPRCRRRGRRPGPSPRDRYQHMVDYRDLEADLRRLATRSRTSMKAVMLAAHLKVMSMICGDRGLLHRAGLRRAARGRRRRPGARHVPQHGAVRDAGGRAAPGVSWSCAVYDGLTELWPHRVFPLQVIQSELGSGGRLLDVFFNYLDFRQVDSRLLDEEQVLNDNDNEFALHVFSISGVVRLNTTNHRLNRAAADQAGGPVPDRAGGDVARP